MITRNYSVQNLNAALISSEGPDEAQVDYSVQDGDISAYFKNIRGYLISHISKAKVVVGSVAWLTDYEILQALSKSEWVSIIVQKEDFLRSDMGRASKPELRALYKTLPPGNRYDVPGLVGDLSVSTDPTIDPVRCVGNINRSGGTHPRAHNKFVVFCNLEEDPEDHAWGSRTRIKPYGVWTGSFNFSHTATLSLENAIYTTRPRIVNAYFNEWQQICALSEPLDWTREWVEPEWRIGT